MAYVGSKGTHLQVLRDYNQPPPGPGDPQERRPYPAVRKLRVDHERRELDLQLGPAEAQQALQQRHLAPQRVHLQQGVQRPAGDLLRFALAARQPTTSTAERGPADYDQRYRSVTSFAWDLPFGKGRHFLDKEGVLNGIFGGWQLGGIVTITAGFPFSPATSLDTSNTGTFGQLRPDQIGNPDVADRRAPPRWYNPEAYATPAEFTFGNAGRNSLVGPGTRTADLYVRKEFKVGKRAHLELRVEAFNAFNHPNFGLPDNYVDDGESAGTITYTSIAAAAGPVRCAPRVLA